MANEQPIRDHLVGFRVTEQEHDLLSRHALADERTVTGMLRKMLAETVAGFGPNKREHGTERQEKTR